MIQLNLLPDVKKEYLRSQRVKRTVIGVSILVTIASMGLAALLFITVYFVQPGLISLKQSEIDSRLNELRAVPEIEKYLTIQNQLNALPQLHDQKVLYSRLFNFLKVLNPAPPDNIRLSSLQVDEENKTILLTGTTASFKSFSVFQDTLAKAEITYKEFGSDEQLTDTLFEPGGIVIENQALATNQGQPELSFSIRATYKEIAFKPSVESIELKVPNIQTTQSVTGTPQRANEEPLLQEDSEGGDQ